MSDLDTLLDSTLDDLEDLPSFTPFPPGAHRVLATFAQKEINGKPAIELVFKMVETIELTDENDARPKEGDTSNTMFMLDNEYGRGNLKKCATPFGEALQLNSIRDIVDQVADVECIIMTSLRQDKNDPNKKYLQVKEIGIE